MTILKQIAFFILLSMTFYLGILFILNKIKVGKYSIVYSVLDGSTIKAQETYKRFNEFDEAGNYDLVVMGSSHAYRGYDIRNFEKIGFKAYNLGSNAQEIEVTNILANELVQNTNAKHVILEIFPILFIKYKSIESASYVVSNCKTNHLAFSICKYYNDPRLWNQYLLRLINTNTAATEIPPDSLCYKGYCINRDTIKQIEKVLRIIEKPNPHLKLGIDEKKLNALSLILETLHRKGIKTIVCTHYCPIETDSTLHHLVTPMFKEICKKNNVTYLDYSYKHSLNTATYFYDHHHLNANGVKVYNDSLINDLKRLHFF